MNKIIFNYNWNNKLDCNVFTTLRLTNKYIVDDKIQIFFNKEFRFYAEIVGKKSFLLEEINDFVAYIDTGYNSFECQNILRKMYKKKNVDWTKQKINFYLIKRIKEEK